MNGKRLNSREAFTLYEVVSDYLISGKQGIEGFPRLITRIINEEAWRERTLPQDGRLIVCESFLEYLTAPPVKGVGATLEQARNLCKHDATALDALDRATQGKPGAPVGNQNAAVEKTTVDNINNCNDRPDGTSSARALRTLRKRRPDLHAQVLEGLKSAHGAMVEAGFRHKTVTVRADDPAEFVRAGLRIFSEDELISALRAARGRRKA